jgi:ferrous iron transport protein A
MTRRLSELSPGQKGRIVQLDGEGNTHRRIAAMGLTRGAQIEVKRIAPLGDPVEFSVRGYRLSMRRREADDITVEID